MAKKMKMAIGIGTFVVLLAGGYLVTNAWTDKEGGPMTGQAAQSLKGGEPTPSNNESITPETSSSATPTSATPTPPSDESPDASVIPTPSSDKSTATTPKPNNEGYTPEVSHDKAKEVQNEISLSEQVKITAVLLKKLNASDLKLFQSLFDGGMSLDEKKKAKEIIMKKLTSEEYDELIAIASKYGLSRGKSYEESLHEQK